MKKCMKNFINEEDNYNFFLLKNDIVLFNCFIIRDKYDGDLTDFRQLYR